MAWFWRADGADAASEDQTVVGLNEPFESQSAAEAWLTGNYAELVDLGVLSVSIYEEARLVYGPMSLDA